MPPEPWASSRGIKRELRPDSPLVPDNIPSKRQAPGSREVGPKTIGFPWETCHNVEGIKRLRIKENAVKIANEACKELRREFIITIFQGRADPAVMGQVMIDRWLKEYDELQKKHETAQILVGVEGPTGAGKSSFLGALLRLYEVFPVGHDGAATAVVGKVSWNYVDTPGHEFRARLTFRHQRDVEMDLELLMKDLERVLELESIDFINVEDPEERENDIAIAEERISYELPRVKAVWGLERQHLEHFICERKKGQSNKDIVQAILKKNPTVLQYLDRRLLDFQTDTRLKLRRMVTPFLDSSLSQNGSALKLAVWPLVKEVHMFVRSDILKSGMTLVDLPGCGDATASRSEIAKAFTHQLDVRMVVSPIHRAADEAQGQALMLTGFDEAQMKISGKPDGHGFGIILTMSDHLEVPSYIESSTEMENNPQFKAKRERHKELEQGIPRLKCDIRDAKLKVKDAEIQKNKATKTLMKAMQDSLSKIRDQQGPDVELFDKLNKNDEQMAQALQQNTTNLSQLQNQIQDIEQEMDNIDAWIHDFAFQTRNMIVRKRIQDKHAMHQASSKHTDNSALSPCPPIFAVSTNAFFKLLKDSPVKGFATLDSTGIPATERWLLKATMSKREKHLDAVLRKYVDLMHLMTIYSRDNIQDVLYHVTRPSVEGVLDKTHRHFSAAMATKLSVAATKISSIDPLKKRDEIVEEFRNKAIRKAAKWSRKYPNKERNKSMMAAGTYKAILVRSGRTYTPKSGDKPRITYSWVEDLATLLIRSIASAWDRSMNHELLNIKHPIKCTFKKVWADYLREIEKLVKEELPVLETSFNSLLSMASDIELGFETQIFAALETLAKETSTVGLDVVEFLVEELGPTFAIAAKMTGKGSFQRRRDCVTSKIQRCSEDLGKSVLNHLAKKLENKKKEMPDKLIKIGLDSIDNLKQKISFLLNNLVEHYEADEESKEKKLGLQAKVRELVGEWEQRWQQWDLHSEQLSNSASAFPGGVGKTETEEEDSEIDSTEAVMAGFATANADVMDTVESFETA